MSLQELVIEGARQNNLKNITLAIPHNKVVAVTGLSGSGKSSLAFDTIFAEGQWRFIESLSTYARLFLEKLDRPDVDAIRNVRPAIALEQKNPVKGSRSTVGTLTELYDVFRLLYSRIAVPHCTKCGKEIRKWDPSQIAALLLEDHAGERALITFESGESAESLVQRGFHRALHGGSIMDLSGEGPLLPERKEVVLDRLVIRDEPRLSDSLEMAWREGKQRLRVLLVGEKEMKVLPFSAQNSCDDCGITLPEPSPILFSFNHPLCACPECKGFGNILVYDEDLLVPDKLLSLSEGAIDLWEKPGYRWWKKQMLKGVRQSGLDVTVPFKNLAKDDRELIFKGNDRFHGINAFFEEMESKRYKLHVRVFLSRYRSPVTCPSCRGRRLCDDALAYRVDGRNIAEISDMPISEIGLWLDEVHLSPMQRDLSREALAQVRAKVRFLERVGLGYLSLSRQAKTLSGGEYQRVSLSNQLGSALVGTLYVLDEPTIGLHPRDTGRIIEIMREISALGNTIIVVEHDREVIASADWVVELGPGGGHLGGEILFSGPIGDFLSADTLTARSLRRDQPQELPPYHFIQGQAKPSAKAPGPSLRLLGARGNNLRNVDVTIPLSSLTVVTGVSGSGKSSLVIDTLHRALARHFKTDSTVPLPFRKLEGLNAIKGVRLVDQSPIGKTPRSNPLTYLKIFEPIRKLFARQMEAKAHRYTPGFFSFNIPGGRCETCKGEGYQRLEMYFFEDVFVRCEDCKGRRYGPEALRVTYRGKNVSEVLDMTVEEAHEFFGEEPDIRARLSLLREIGLGYLRLGQPATTLSGGEAQRLKICAELSALPRFSTKGILYLLDEPTVGLHHNDIVLFMSIIRKLIDAGNTVVVIEHNLDVVSQADWVIDLGPEGGHQGGAVVFEGPPEELVESPHSHTARYLKEYLAVA
jgi:excinuclease ABC subunit A